MIEVVSIPCTSERFAQLSAELLGCGVSIRFRARGTSMAPLIREGDLVTVRPIGSGCARVGDVVLFRAEEGRAMVHRVIRHGANGGLSWYTIQGDRVDRPDGTFDDAQLCGRAVEVCRDGVRIDLERPAMRLLGWLAVLHARLRTGRDERLHLGRRVGRKLPVLSKYLA